jgi:hypothetical protein
MATESTDLVPKVPSKYTCKMCDYNTSRCSQYERHLTTTKHLKRNEATEMVQKVQHHIPGSVYNKYMCNNCSREYKDRSGLWKHSKTCTSSTQIVITPLTETDEKGTDEIDTNEIETDEMDDKHAYEKDKVIDFLIKENAEFKNIVLEVMKNNSDLQKQNNEIQKQMIEVCKNNSINTINSHNNNNNKTFNLQFFLNEQCKDAMNITDFANSFDLQLSDLETVGELGYVNGITKIMVDKLNSMDIYKRPIHCSDAKREIIYVKDENVWTKEEKDNPKLRQAIKNVSFRNMKLVYNWSNTYPESKDNQSRLNDKYMQLVIQSTGGNNPILESENKIIRRIAKEIVIGKNNF